MRDLKNISMLSGNNTHNNNNNNNKNNNNDSKSNNKNIVTTINNSEKTHFLFFVLLHLGSANCTCQLLTNFFVFLFHIFATRERGATETERCKNRTSDVDLKND